MKWGLPGYSLLPPRLGPISAWPNVNKNTDVDLMLSPPNRCLSWLCQGAGFGTVHPLTAEYCSTVPLYSHASRLTSPADAFHALKRERDVVTKISHKLKRECLQIDREMEQWVRQILCVAKFNLQNLRRKRENDNGTEMLRVERTQAELTAK